MMDTPAMERLIWITDPHFDSLDSPRIHEFLQEAADSCGDGAVVITGDIANARTLEKTLQMIHGAIAQVFFVLGNHDAYGGSIAGARAVAHGFPGYLTTKSEPARLTATTCLMGHDGWSDGRAGNYDASSVMLNDYLHIEELANLTKAGRFLQLNRLGDEAAEAIGAALPHALASYPHVILATHVPPFQEACWHEGKASDPDWSPHFSSHAVGQVLLDVMARYPQRRLTVLCGHTHSPGVYRPTDNIVVHTGGADYGRPAIQGVFPVDDFVPLS